MNYSQKIDGCLDDQVGAHGLSLSEFEAAVAATEPALDKLRKAYEDRSLPILRVPEDRDDVADFAEAAERLRETCSDILVLGTGGSSLGAQALVQLTGFRTTFDAARAAPLRLHFFDNLDADSFDRAITALDLERTGILTISKSGGTAETLIQTLAAFHAFEQAGLAEKLPARCVAVTEPGDRVLRRLTEVRGIPVLDHHSGVGGRFSVLTNVGLLPAAIAGLDVMAVRDGAREVVEAMLDAAPPGCAPAIGAALSVALARQKGKTSSVLMPYADRFERLAFWYRQLWAESLGKGGNGTTPINALGPVDQHSQLQLYLDGPNDKLVTILMTNAAGTGPRVAAGGEADLAYLDGRTIGDLVDAEQRATARTLIRNGRPTRVFHVDEPDEKIMGALMMHFMLETIIAADILGIDAFDQPAVEQGKVLARDYLSKM